MLVSFQVQLCRYLAWSELRDALGQLNINSVFDVGANRGQFATGLRKIGYTGWIISFEPSPDDFVTLSHRFEGDQFWRGYQFLKMDTQGFDSQGKEGTELRFPEHDIKVIEGASGCIDRMLGLLSEITAEANYENMPSYLESLNIYEGLGFRLKGLSEIAWNRNRGTLVEMDCLMIRKND